MPEPAGRSFAELDLLFEKGVSARKFSQTPVDVWGENVDGGFMDKYQRQMDFDHVEKRKGEP